MTRLTCKCKTCETNNASAVDVPDTFAPALDRNKIRHSLVYQANHPNLGRGFRAQTGICLAA